jgi:hypothetical protein
LGILFSSILYTCPNQCNLLMAKVKFPLIPECICISVNKLNLFFH